MRREGEVGQDAQGSKIIPIPRVNVKTELGQNLSSSCFLGPSPPLHLFFPSEKGVKSIFLWDSW